MGNKQVARTRRRAAVGKEATLLGLGAAGKVNTTVAGLAANQQRAAQRVRATISSSQGRRSGGGALPVHRGRVANDL